MASGVRHTALRAALLAALTLPSLAGATGLDNVLARLRACPGRCA